MTTETEKKTQKPIPLVSLDEVLRFIKKTGDLPRAACKVGEDVVMLYGWTRHDGRLKLEFRIIENFKYTVAKKKVAAKSK